MAGAIDLRDPQGKFGGSFQAVSDIIGTIKKAETLRQNRKTLNEITALRAANPEAPLEDIIAQITAQGTQFDPGIAGFIQKFASGAGGQGTVLPELQASRITTPVQEAQIKASEALATSRTAGKVTPPFKKTPEEIQRDRDIAFLDKAKGKPFQIREAQDRLKALPPGNLVQIKPSKENDKAFEKLTGLFVGKIKPTSIRKTEKGFKDKVFGRADFETFVEESVNEGLKNGIDPASMEAAALEWWNRQFEKEKDEEFQKFIKIETSEPTGVEQSPEQIIQQAADEGLLTAEDVQSITAGLQADPSKLQDVLDLIERKRSGK